MAMYTALVYPATTAGESYTRPPLPSTFITVYASCPDWDPYSYDPADRTEYWEDSAGMLTEDDVAMAVHGAQYIVDEQIKAITDYYEAAASLPIQFTTAASVTALFQTDDVSKARITWALAASTAVGKTPDGFYWVAADNTRVAPFTVEDLQGLASAILVAGNTLFQHLQNRKAQVRAAKTVAAVHAVVW